MTTTLPQDVDGRPLGGAAGLGSAVGRTDSGLLVVRC
jgi:hypothetical protein